LLAATAGYAYCTPPVRVYASAIRANGARPRIDTTLSDAPYHSGSALSPSPCSRTILELLRCHLGSSRCFGINAFVVGVSQEPSPSASQESQEPRRGQELRSAWRLGGHAQGTSNAALLGSCSFSPAWLPRRCAAQLLPVAAAPAAAPGALSLFFPFPWHAVSQAGRCTAWQSTPNSFIPGASIHPIPSPSPFSLFAPTDSTHQSKTIHPTTRL
jgi:hypothetical protein